MRCYINQFTFMRDLLKTLQDGKGEYRWSTECHHEDNVDTMCDFLDYHLPCDYEILLDEGTRCEIRHKDGGDVLELNASGDGCAYNHLIEISTI